MTTTRELSEKKVGLVCMFEYERAQTKEKDSLNVYLSMHICAHVCVRDSGGYRKKPCPKSARLMA